MGQAIGWFSSIDKVFEKKNVVEKKVEPVQKSEIESKPINNGSDVKLKKVSVTDAGQIDRIQQANNQQREKNQSLEENQQVELKVDGPLINLEKNLQQEGFQPVISSEKKQEQETLLADKKIPTQENQVESVKQKVSSAKELHEKKLGVVGQVLGWFSSMDRVFEDDEIEKNEEPTQKVEIERKSEAKETFSSVVTIADDEETSFSEKLAEVADTMDSFSGKFKSLYRKVRK